VEQKNRAPLLWMLSSFFIALLLLFIKAYAYWITGSVAIYSDLLESLIHTFIVLFALMSMIISFFPPDENHPYGHEKISFFSAGFEGATITLAAICILYEAISKLIFGIQLNHIDQGVLFIVLVIVLNGTLGLTLLRVAHQKRSLILEAHAKHVLTDCWTSVAVLGALLAVQLTGWPIFDPLIAILAAGNIIKTGIHLVRQSFSGLMDQKDQEIDKKIRGILDMASVKHGASYHALRHRKSGDHKLFIEFHLLFPEETKLSRAHDAATAIEKAVTYALEYDVEVLSHLEPQESHDATHKKYHVGI
jgi:cation diffusion facilitator family transporter